MDINTVVAGGGTRLLFRNGGRGAEASLVCLLPVRDLFHFLLTILYALLDYQIRILLR
jgi:hypothetical protein